MNADDSNGMNEGVLKVNVPKLVDWNNKWWFLVVIYGNIMEYHIPIQAAKNKGVQQ